MDTQSRLIHEMRWKAVKGEFHDIMNSAQQWKIPSWKLLVFISSTFTDTQIEREILINDILPKLRERGRMHDIEVTFVDMRWGVRDENTMDHRTWIECSRELQRCKNDSCGLFFLSLQSEKYGYTPLPKTVIADHFQNKINLANERQLEIAKEWYTLDENSIPAQFVLKNLASISDSVYWNEVLPSLSIALDEMPLEDAVVSGRSVTEWEVRAALNNSSDVSRAFWLHRSFRGGISQLEDPKQFFSDAYNGKKVKFDNLIQWMKEHFSGRNIEYSEATFQSYKSVDSIWIQQLDTWKRDAEFILTSSLDDIIKFRMEWAKPFIQDYGLPEEELNEILLHCQALVEWSTSYKGNEALVERIILETMRFDEFPIFGNSHCISGVVVGSSGMGKTALLAKLAMELSKAQQNDTAPFNFDESFKDRLIIVRFCGISSNSSDALSLMLSISAQIDCFLGRQFEQRRGQTFEEVKDYFQTLLRQHPVVLFLDSLDQLENFYQERTTLNFLQCSLHPRSVVFVSTLRDELDPKSGIWTNYYGPFTRLTSDNKIMRLYDLDIEFETQCNHKIVESRLRMQCRTLTANQWEVVDTILYQENLPLYSEMAVRIVRNWTSQTNPYLPPGIDNIINIFFDSVERSYGSILVRAAVAFITFSFSGIGDAEMEDLLSLDQGVMDSINQYNIADRLPSHVWLRVRSEFGTLLVEKHGALSWFHKLVRNTVSSRYSFEEKKRRNAMLAMLAQYFGDNVTTSQRVKCRARRQPLLFGNDISNVWHPMASINKRRCLEAAFNMIEAGNLENAVTELCSLDVACAYARLSLTEIYVDRLQNLSDALESSSHLVDEQRLVRTYLTWIRRHYFVVRRDPLASILRTASTVPLLTSAVRRLLNEYYEITYSDISYTSLSGTNYFIVGGPTDDKISCVNILQVDKVHQGFKCLDCKTVGAADFLVAALDSIARAIYIWKASTGALFSQIDNFEFGAAVTCFAFHPVNSQLIISVDSACSVRDLLSGTVIQELSVPHDDSFAIKSLSTTVDGNMFVSCCGKEIHFRIRDNFCCYRGHSSDITCHAMSLDGNWIAVGLDDGAVYVWPLNGVANPIIVGQHKMTVTCISFDSSSTMVISGSKDASLGVWGIITKDAIKQIDLVEKADARSLRLSANFLFAGTSDGSIKIFSLPDFVLLSEISLEDESGVSQLDLNFDETFLLALSSVGAVFIFNISVDNDKISLERIGKIHSHPDFILGACRFMPFSNELLFAMAIPNDQYPNADFNLMKIIKHDCVANKNTTREAFIHKEMLVIAFNQNCSYIICGSVRNRIPIFNLSTLEWEASVPNLSHHIISLSLSTSGKILAWGTSAYLVIVDTRCAIPSYQIYNSHPRLWNMLSKVVVSSDENFIGTGSVQGGCKVWNIQGIVLIDTIPDQVVLSVCFNNKCTHIAASCQSGWLYVWDIESRSETLKLLPDNANVLFAKNSVFDACFSQDDKYIFTACSQKIQCWTVDGNLLCSINAHTNVITNMKHIVISGSRNMLVSCSVDGSVKVWEDFQTVSSNISQACVASFVSIVCYHPILDIVAIAGTNEVQVWSISSENITLLKQFNIENGYSPPTDLQFSPDGEKLFCCAAETLRVWQWKAGCSICSLRTNSTTFCFLSDYSSDVMHFFVGCKDSLVRIIAEKEVNRTIRTPDSKQVQHLRSCPKYKCLAASYWNSQTVHMFDLNILLSAVDTEAKPQFELVHDTQFQSLFLCFNHRGDRLATSSGGNIKLWSVETGELKYNIFTGQTMVSSIVFTPDDKRIITGLLSSLKLYAVDDESYHNPHILNKSANLGKESGTLSSSTNYLNSVAISPNGAILVATSADNTLQVWFSTNVKK